MAITLASLKRKPSANALRTMVYGVHGVGKTTFAASAPAPIIFCIEDGLGALPLEDAAELTKATFNEVMEHIRFLYEEEHPFQSLIVDSLDWLEPKVWAETCARGDGIVAWPDIEHPGFGKGYVAAARVWREFFDGLNLLRTDRKMHIILIAHSQIKQLTPPDTEPYERYEPKLHKQASALVQEWADMVLFCNYQVSIIKDQKGTNKKNTHARGVGSGRRIAYTSERPAWLAKQRFNLPDSVPLDIGFSGVIDIISGKMPVPAQETEEAD